MSLTMKTESAISGRGMKNMSPFAGVQDTYGASRVANSREITGAVCRAAQCQR
jgi:hypothetical protein